MFNICNLEEFKKRISDGRIVIESDEIIKDGLPYCARCGEPRFIEILGTCFRCLCRCEAERQAREIIEKEKQCDFSNKQARSLISERYKNVFLDTAKITENNKLAIEKAKNYVEHADEALRENIGLYFTGDNSTGKTYLTACICNELMKRGKSCIYVNLQMVLADEYKLNSENCRYIKDRFVAYQFAFIDDLGKEFIGREYKADAAKWAERILFDLINARYNAKMPIIFSSNFKISELADKLNLDKGIIERINAMSTRIIELKNDDFRIDELNEKSEKAKLIGI